MEYTKREDIPEKYKWDLSSRFENFKHWEEFYEVILTKIKNHVIVDINDSKTLYDALEMFYSLQVDVIKLNCYALLRLDEDLSNNEAIRIQSMADELITKFDKTFSYLEPTILKLNIEKLKEEEILSKYKYYLTTLENKKKHILSESDEKLISTLSFGYDKLSNINATLLNSEIEYGNIVDEFNNKITLIPNNMRKFLTSDNRNIRKSTYLKSNKGRIKHQNTIGSNLIIYMSYMQQIAKIRNYKNATEMIFDNKDTPYLVNKVLTESVRKRISSNTAYFELLKNVLKIKKLEPFDITVPPFSSTKTYEIDEAQNLIKEGLSILGEKYTEVLNKALDERWIDYFGYKGKINGAYSLSNYGDTPVILLSYNKKFDDILTIVHEIGHAINSYFKAQNNYSHTFFTDTISSEITSLTNEIIFSNYLLQKTNDSNEKKVILYNLISTIKNNLFGASFQAEFEDKVYEKLSNEEIVTPENLNEINGELFKVYYPTIKEHKYSKNNWMAISHFFRPYYVYSYSVSVSIACFIGSEIAKGNTEIKDKYLDFLYLGKQEPVVDKIKKLGIDITNESVYLSAIDYYDSLIKQLEELL